MNCDALGLNVIMKAEAIVGATITQAQHITLYLLPMHQLNCCVQEHCAKYCSINIIFCATLVMVVL